MSKQMRAAKLGESVRCFHSVRPSSTEVCDDVSSSSASGLDWAPPGRQRQRTAISQTSCSSAA
eukprot:scaffold191356_cov28-Tisochrysis_lutea.AAC.1